MWTANPTARASQNSLPPAPAARKDLVTQYGGMSPASSCHSEWMNRMAKGWEQ